MPTHNPQPVTHNPQPTTQDPQPVTHDPLPLLVTDRLRIRPLSEEDLPALFALFSDPEVVRYWELPLMREPADAVRFLEAVREGLASRTLLEWGVTEAAGGPVIGTVAFSGWIPAHRRAEVGFALRRDRWGRGLASEALRALLRFGFEEMGLHRVEADVDPRNEASLRCLERLGFRREGYLRERYFVQGEIQDTVLLGLLRSDARPLLEERR